MLDLICFHFSKSVIAVMPNCFFIHLIFVNILLCTNITGCIYIFNIIYIYYNNYVITIKLNDCNMFRNLNENRLARFISFTNLANLNNITSAVFLCVLIIIHTKCATSNSQFLETIFSHLHAIVYKTL